MFESKVCKIYKLFNSVSDRFYIGSTFNEIRYRLNRGHKWNYTTWKNKNKQGKYMSSYIILEEVENIKNIKWEEVYRENIIIKIIDDKKQMKIEFDRKKRDIERKFILKFKEECGDRCVNTQIPFGGSVKEWTKEYYNNNKEKIKEYMKEYRKENKDKRNEWRENNKDKIKEYYENNKDEILKQRKEYGIKNKDIIAERRKEYYKNNKEKIAKQKKEYYKFNKEKITNYKKIKIECQYCKSIIRKDNLKRHQNSLKCKTFQNI